MFNKIKKINIIILSLFLLFSENLFCESNTPQPYNMDEFPQAFKDIRRFEIITLGSMPFVMLDVEIGYAGYLCVKNNMDTSYLSGIFGSNEYTEEEQKKIILTSLGISCGIGLVDFTINKIKYAVNQKKSKLKTTQEVNITPIDQDPDATKIIFPIEDEPEENNLNIDDEIQVIDEVIEVTE